MTDSKLPNVDEVAPKARGRSRCPRTKTRGKERGSSNARTAITRARAFGGPSEVDWLHYPGQENEGGRSLERKDLR